MTAQSVSEGTVLWEPSDEIKKQAITTKYINWLKTQKGLSFNDYNSLWHWSVTEIEDFWQSLWEFFEIKASKPFSCVLSERKMPGAEWFVGSELNYAEHVFRHMTPDRAALMFQSEIRPLEEISWDGLYRKVAAVRTSLGNMGVKRGDRVVAYIPNIPEAIIAFLACAAIGATWSSCSPDFGTRCLINRFKQIEPKVLLTVDGYQYGGKSFDCLTAISELQQSLLSLENTILIPFSPEGFGWVYDHVKKDILLGSVSGGTDPCTAFLGCSPLLPVRAGELQCRCLGVSARAYDEDGNSLIDEVGELVITEPMPSMPLYLWNDPENTRYNECYFDIYPGVWRHDDWLKITSRGSGVILGRSDSTINRFGVRMGSSEIYAAVEELEEIADSLVFGFETPAGQYVMPLFVVLTEGVELDDSLKKSINDKIRTALSPRHVPDEIYAIPEVPRTLNAKKLEVPVKKILSGIPVEKAVNIDSMGNPEAIDYFVRLAHELNKKQ